MPDPVLLGRPAIFSFEGVQYPSVTFLTRPLEVEAAFVAWLEVEAYLAVERARGKMGPAWYAEQSAATRRDVASQVYAWGGLCCHEALWSVSGIKQMAFLQLQWAEAQALQDPLRRAQMSPQQSATPELVERASRDPAKWREIQRLVLPLPDENPDPNSPGSSGTRTSSGGSPPQPSSPGASPAASALATPAA
jgi:hypothetical protein